MIKVNINCGQCFTCSQALRPYMSKIVFLLYYIYILSYLILYYIILYYITLYYIILCIHGGFQKSRYPQIIFISVTDLHGLTIASSITVLPPCWESPCQLEICCSMVICYIANWNLYPIYRFFTY